MLLRTTDGGLEAVGIIVKRLFQKAFSSTTGTTGDVGEESEEGSSDSDSSAEEELSDEEDRFQHSQLSTYLEARAKTRRDTLLAATQAALSSFPASLVSLVVEYGSAVYLTVPMWIDALDTRDMWLVAQIISVRWNSRQLPARFFVKFSGWGDHWNEWVDASSDRLAPFARHTAEAQRDARNRISDREMYAAMFNPNHV
eukprot:g80380.t1